MEYDFDEMAKLFSEMRTAFFTLKKNINDEKSMLRYLSLSQRFFDRYPNPFSEHDSGFVPKSILNEDEKDISDLIREEKKLIAYCETLQRKLENLAINKAPAVDYVKWENYLKL